MTTEPETPKPDANQREETGTPFSGQVSKPLSRRGFVSRLTCAASLFGTSQLSVLRGASPTLPHQEPRIPGKHPGLTILNDRPLNAETPPHLLDDRVTPADRLFIRNNGRPPEAVDPETWRLEIGGESAKTAKSYSLNDIKKRFTEVSLQLTLECGGNGRAEFDPPARGNQWTLGAVGCPLWTGIRLADLLEDVGLKEDAVYLAYLGADSHLSGKPGKKPISRGVPIHKALEPESLIAWAINGADLPAHHGYPLRLVFGGWPGSTSGKWLNQLLIRNRVHDGPKMGGKSYRVPCFPIAPGEKVEDKDMCIIESMPVKSLITAPQSGTAHKLGSPLEVRGHCWAGDLAVDRVDVSIDYGQTWQKSHLEEPVNRFAWQHWRAQISFPQKGYFEIWARATDSKGRMQPMVVPGWNPKGYLNNACHRVGVRLA